MLLQRLSLKPAHLPVLLQCRFQWVRCTVQRVSVPRPLQILGPSVMRSEFFAIFGHTFGVFFNVYASCFSVLCNKCPCTYNTFWCNVNPIQYCRAGPHYAILTDCHTSKKSCTGGHKTMVLQVRVVSNNNTLRKVIVLANMIIRDN
jgi:hypothetical protein